MHYLPDIINEAAAYIRDRINVAPTVGIILGSGLGNLADQMMDKHIVPYSDIPHFPVSTVVGHGGNLIIGTIGGKTIVAMQGRFHFYEGYTMREVGLPVWVMKRLGVQTIFISNAAGGLNPIYDVGDIVFVTDHINLAGNNPLIGINHDELGPRFPDQHAVYDKLLIEKAKEIARANQIKSHCGVYVGVTGPTFETPAEYKFMNLIGGDIVGMSTVPEVIVANHSGMRIFCVSVVTDLGNPPVPRKITHQEVVEAAAAAEPRMRLIIEKLIETL